MVNADALVEKLPVAVAPARPSLWRDALRRFRRRRLAMIGTTVLLVMVVAVVAGPLAWRLPVNEIDFKQKLKGPTWSHPLGTDDLGQDLLARMLYGGRISLAVGVAAMLIAISLGTAIGAASGYMGGAVDHTLMRLTDLFLSIPALPLLLLIVYLFRDALKKAVGPRQGSSCSSSSSSEAFAGCRSRASCAPSSCRSAKRVRRGGAGPRCAAAQAGRPAHPAQRDGACHRRGLARRRRGDHRGVHALVPGPRLPARHPDLGTASLRRQGQPGLRPPLGDLSWDGDLPHRPLHQ